MRVPPLPAPLGWHSFLVIWILGLLSAVWPVPSALLLVLLCYLDKTLWRIPRLCLGILLALLAYWTLTSLIFPLAGSLQSANIAQDVRNARVCGTVTGLRGLNDQRLRIFLQDVVINAEEQKTLTGTIAWTWENPVSRPSPGQRACISRTLKPVHSFANDGLVDFSFWWYAQGISWQIWSRGEQGAPSFEERGFSTPSDLRESLYHSFVSVLQKMSDDHTPSQAQAMLLALVFGDRFFLSPHIVDLFADGALAHSLALSGQHLAVVALAGVLCVLCLAWRRPEIYLLTTRRRWIFVFSVPPALIYLWLGNAPASLIRAFCMLCLLALFHFLARQRTILDILALALAGILAVWPAGILDTSLQLSAACIFAIGITVTILRRIHLKHFLGDSILGRIARYSIEMFLLSLCLQIILFPLNLALFHNPGYWFPLNLLWLPVVSFIVLPCSLLGTFALALDIQSFAEALLACAAAPCDWMIQLLTCLEQHGLLHSSPLLRPFWTAIPALGCLSAALALHLSDTKQLARNFKMRLAVTGFLLSLFGPLLHLETLHSSDIELTMYDVGQGQALGLRFPGNLRFLIDGGGAYSKRFDVGKSIVLPALSYNNSPRVNTVIATHPDTDHIGGLFHIIRKASPNLVFDNGYAGSTKLAKDWEKLFQTHGNRHLGAGDVLVIGPPEHGLRLHVLHPPHHSSMDAPKAWRDNDASIVLRLTRHGQGLLLIPGDAGPAVLSHLVQSGQDLTAQILVASHHGSDNNFEPTFIEAVKPETILASCGFQNRFGFPGKALTKWIKTRGIPFYHTDEKGAISVTWNRHGHWTIRSTREGTLLRQRDMDL